MQSLEDRPLTQRGPSRTCATCRFWQADPDTPANELGECRINPPQFDPLPGDPDEPDTQAGLPRRPWPTTADDDWCACWRHHRSSMRAIFRIGG